MAGVLVFASALCGCNQVNTPMRPGVPLEIHRGYCLTDLEFSQRGEPVNRVNTLKHLARYTGSQPHLNAGSNLGLGSIGATLVSTSTFTVGLLGANDTIEMSDGAATALIVTGLSVGALSWVLCITSEGQYAKAAEVYNQRFEKKDAEPSSAPAPVVREPGDDGVYDSPASSAGHKKPPPPEINEGPP